LVVKLGRMVGVDVLPSSFNINKPVKELDAEIVKEDLKQHTKAPNKE